MPAALMMILRVGVQVLAGVGLGSVLDKLFADKLPAWPGSVPPDVDYTKPGFNPFRLVLLILSIGISAIILAFVGKKFKIKFLNRKI